MVIVVDTVEEYPVQFDLRSHKFCSLGENCEFVTLNLNELFRETIIHSQKGSNNGSKD